MTFSVAFPAASVLEVLTSFSPSRTSTTASDTGRFFSSITESWIVQPGISSAHKAFRQPQLASHSRNAPTAALRSRADSNRARKLSISIRMRMARNNVRSLRSSHLARRAETDTLLSDGGDRGNEQNVIGAHNNHLKL